MQVLIRAFEIPASGGVQLTDYVTGMEELLLPGKEVLIQNTFEGAEIVSS